MGLRCQRKENAAQLLAVHNLGMILCPVIGSESLNADDLGNLVGH